MDLERKVAVVTGGNGGLGRRICHSLAKAGADVAVVYARSRREAEQVAVEVARHGVRAHAIGCDLTDPQQIEQLTTQVVERFGSLHVLVNDAAYNIAIPFQDLDGMTLSEWDKIMAVNLTGPMLCTKAVAPIMKRHGGGRIVNISSIAGLAPRGSSIAYAVSKAGLIHLTRCMSVALAPEVLVNCVAPGLLEGTRASANLAPGQIERATSGTLLKMPADKDDVADQVLTMCRTDTMTGQTVVVDSGVFFH